jgi:DNA-cytosine methyltransferase
MDRRTTTRRDLPTTLDLFSGIGGLCLALKPFSRTVCYVENDPACQAVLQARMESGDIDNAPIFSDIREISHGDVMTADGTVLKQVDRIVGGFPCQDISIMGAHKGFEGNKSSLFFFLMDAVRRFNPAEVILENVANIVSMYEVWTVVLKNLADAGYTHVRWATVSAGDVGAPHLRKRCFFLCTKIAPSTLHGGDVPGMGKRAEPFNNSNGWIMRTTGRRKGEPRIPRFLDIDEDSKKKKLVPKELTYLHRRLHQLGNVVCPQQGRLAVQCLWNSCGVRHKSRIPRKATSLPPWGYLHNGTIISLRKPQLPAVMAWPNRVIVPPPVPEGEDPNLLITEPWTRPRFPTHLCGGFLPTKRLTKRRCKDMGSALYYDQDTTVAERRSVRLNPQFIEWMQGFRPDFTKVS